ncbi:hypothetical protein [Rhizobacter fulvus]
MHQIAPRNWRDFQHYRDRNPPWIRLHKALLDNFDFQRLPVASRALAPMLWLLASDSVDGAIDADPEKLAFRLRMTIKEVSDSLKPLIDKKFFDVVHDASNPLAVCEQVAVPETETETETEHAPRADFLFEEFWKAWPRTDRKEGKSKCRDLWKAKGYAKSAELIVAHVRAKASTADWTKDAGQFVPAPIVYLRKEAWDGAEVEVESAFAGSI